jgi:menaquinone-dependent protoporphyrinogen oxidase
MIRTASKAHATTHRAAPLARRVKSGSVMRVLVVHASEHGHTAAIADSIALHLERAHHEVEVVAVTAGAPSPADYDAVVLGSRIRGERAARALVRYARRYRAELAVRPTALFLVCLAAARPSGQARARRYLERTVADLGWRPDASAVFAGGLPYLRYRRPLRWLMRQLAQVTGAPTDTSRNHDLTAWDRVAAFAQDLVASLGPVAAPGPTAPPDGVPVVAHVH